MLNFGAIIVPSLVYAGNDINTSQNILRKARYRPTTTTTTTKKVCCGTHGCEVLVKVTLNQVKMTGDRLYSTPIGDARLSHTSV